MDIKLFWTITFATFLHMNCQLQVNRKKNGEIRGTFYYYSSDVFKNPTKAKVFCTSRNAVCDSNSCSSCICSSNSTFISYQHGCLNYSVTNQLLQDSSCMRIGEYQNTIPIAYSLVNFQCLDKLYLPRNVPAINYNIGACSTTQLSYYEMKYGREIFNQNNRNHAKFIIDKENRNYCLKCNPFRDCNIPSLSGHLMKLSIQCSITRTTRKFNTCFIFMFSGKHDEVYTPPADPVVPIKEKGSLSVRRTIRNTETHQNGGGYLYSSIDVFTNHDKEREFCEELNAVCYDSSACTSCKCKEHARTFVSFQQGCSNGTENILGIESCLKSWSRPKEVFTIQPEDFKYATCINLQLPSNLHGTTSKELSCAVSNLTTIDPLTGEEESLSLNNSQIPFRVQFSSVFIDHLCLQCVDFRCDLSKYSGMLLKLSIQGRNKTNNQIAMDSCFVFTMGGEMYFNDTDESTVDISLQGGSIKVQRNSVASRNDVFTNPIHDGGFCEKLKSSCEKENCSKCKCLDDYSTFFSYKRGCINNLEERQLYGKEMCLESESNFIQPSYFKRRRCLYFQKPNGLLGDDQSCVVDSIGYFEPIYGEEKILPKSMNPFRIKSSKAFNRSNQFCLQCQSYTCNLSELSGKMMKLGIQCADPSNSKIRNVCLGLKLDGTFVLNRTYPFFKLEEGGNSKNNGNDSVVLGAVIPCVLILILVLVLLVYLRRKKQNKKMKTRCAHHVFDDKNTEISRPQGNRPMPDYQHLKISFPQMKNSEQKSTAVQKEENMYYKSTEETIKTNPTNSTTIKMSDNPLYGQKRTIQNKDLYTEGDNPTSTRPPAGKQITPIDENIYMEAEKPAMISKPIAGGVGIHNGSVNNPVYGTEYSLTKSPEYLSISDEKNISKGNTGYVNCAPTLMCSQDLTEENEYTLVMPTSQTVDASSPTAEGKYYQVGDIISSK